MTAAPGRPAPDDVLGVPVRPVRIVLAAPLRLQQRSRQRVRLQAGFPKPRRVAVAPQAKYRKQPHAKYQAVAGTDALGQYLTRRANQWHSFIIAQSVKRPWLDACQSAGLLQRHNVRSAGRIRIFKKPSGPIPAT